MHQRKLGPFTVSAIGLGCMNMSIGYGAPDPKESMRLLNECIDVGYSFLDTASMYGAGHNESLIGSQLAHRRSEYLLASKCGIGRNAEGISVANGRPEILKKTCEESLQRLKTDVIDLYYLHRVDAKIPVEESVGALAELVSEGKIKTIGLSEVSAETTYRAHAVHPITAIQSEYSLWSRTPERRLLAVCEELDITFVPFSPLGRSFLTGVLPDISSLEKTDIRRSIAAPRFETQNLAENVKLLKPFGEIARQHDCSMAQLALAWILARGNKNMIPIPGTKSPQHMRENAGAGDIMLEPAVVSALDNLINESTVAGRRYVDKLMASIDSEKD